MVAQKPVSPSCPERDNEYGLHDTPAGYTVKTSLKSGMPLGPCFTAVACWQLEALELPEDQTRGPNKPE